MKTKKRNNKMTHNKGCVITGKFTTYVGSMPMNATGYLKLTDITAK